MPGMRLRLERGSCKGPSAGGADLLSRRCLSVPWSPHSRHSSPDHPRCCARFDRTDLHGRLRRLSTGGLDALIASIRHRSGAHNAPVESRCPSNLHSNRFSAAGHDEAKTSGRNGRRKRNATQESREEIRRGVEAAAASASARGDRTPATTRLATCSKHCFVDLCMCDAAIVTARVATVVWRHPTMADALIAGPHDDGVVVE